MNLPTLPAFTLPAPLARIASCLPQKPPAWILTLALNVGLDRIVPRDSMEALTGRHLRLRVLDAGLSLDFTYGASGFAPRTATGQPDLTLSANLRDYIALALREEDADTLFFGRRLRMEGDTDLGLLVKNTLDAVDWETIQRDLMPATLIERFRAKLSHPRRQAA
ncbi:MAG TPA: SCP2 sterol-binding domain-containing protein [Azoarcus taiwanensis]|nr:SCP2 sterol-binding domain-containing protein [Azoarcus taiwanensis]